MADLFNFAWDKKKPDWLGQDIGSMKLDATNTQQVPNVSFGQSSGRMATAQELGGGAIPQTPMQQSDAGVLGGGSGGVDFAKLAGALGGMAEQPAPMAAVDTRPANAGGQIQPIQLYGGQPQGMSGAMSAIQGGQQMGMAGAMSPEDMRRLRGY